MSTPSTLKYSGETNLYPTADLPLAPPAKAARSSSGFGHEAATNATDGSLFTASSSAPRISSFVTLTNTVSAVRKPVSTVAAANALRRKTAEQMRRSADAVT